LPADSIAKVETVRQAGRDSLKIYANAGVPMGFGSDLLGEMHTFQSDELRIRADVLGNLEALRSATTIAADIVERSGKLGVITAGAIADVLVVDGNPLKDIGVLTGQGERLEYVLQHGEVVSERGTVTSR
jgi:imidazolonepropionase-like amidohydrolase